VRSEVVIGFAALALVGCTLQRTEVDECQRDSDCREAFGVASLCGADGYCELLEDEPRCTVTYPADYEDSPGLYPDMVLVGTIIDQDNTVHRARARAVQVAVQDADDQRSTLGQRFGLVVCNNGDTADSLTQAEASIRIATWLRDVAEVPFIVGPASSDATAAVFGAVDDILLISPSASSEALTTIDVTEPTDANPGRLWRTTVPDTAQAARLVADIEARGIARLAIVYLEGTYGEGLSQQVEAALTGTDVRTYAFASASDLGMRVTEVGASDAQEVLFISSDAAQIASFINTATAGASADDFASKTFLLTDAAANDTFIGGVSDLAAFGRIRGTRPAQPDSDQLATFINQYELRFGEDVAGLSFTPNAFDAAWIGLYAFFWARANEADLSPISLARGLRRLSSGIAVSTTNPGSIAAARDEFAAGNGVDVTGASGALDFDPATEELTGSFEVWVVSDGMLVAAP